MDVRNLVPQRDRTLSDEMAKQQRNEKLRRAFAEKANTLGQWIENQLDAVAAITMQMKGSLEEQLNRLTQNEKAVQQQKQRMEDLESINQVRFIHSLLLFNLGITLYSIDTQFDASTTDSF